MLQGIDVSGYQSTAYGTAGLDFVFIKVTEGLSYVNSKWVAQRATARAAGLVTGFYHYPHIANSPTQEADYFLRQINLAPGDILCLDWEWYGQTVLDSAARSYKDAWLAHVKAQAPGHRVILYADVNNWKNVDQNSNCGDGLWIADYVTAGQPRITAPWLFHQYTDTPLDKDVCSLSSRQALVDWANVNVPAPAPTPTPTPTPAPVPEDDMPQQIIGTIPAGNAATTLAPPAGSAWVAFQHRAFHLVYDEIGNPSGEANVRVAFHDGAKWSAPQTVKVTADGGRVDIAGINLGTVKISVQSDKQVGYAIETW